MKKKHVIILALVAAGLVLVALLSQGKKKHPQPDEQEPASLQESSEEEQAESDSEEDHDGAAKAGPMGKKVLNADYALKEGPGFKILGQALATEVPKNPNLTTDEKTWDQHRDYQQGLADMKKEVTYLPAVYQFTEAMNGKLLTETKDNGIYSPLNVYMTMAMLAETSGGETQQELMTLLGVKSLEENRKNTDLMQRMNEFSDGVTTLHLANAVWLQAGGTYKDETIRQLSQAYGSSAFEGQMGSAAYDQALQAWLNKNTGNLLKEAAGQEGFDSETQFALSSALHFKDQWLTPFFEEATKEGTFHGRAGDTKVDFMHQTLDAVPIYRGKSFDALAKSFDSGCQLWFFRPQNKADLEALLTDPEIGQLLQDPEAYGQKKVYDVDLALPKFDLQAFQDLSKACDELGLRSVFDGQRADFSGLLQADSGTSIQRIDHACRLLVDEKGAEAAAFTLAIAEKGIPEEKEKYSFPLDQPFLAVLTSWDGSPLVVAKVVNLDQ